MNKKEILEQPRKYNISQLLLELKEKRGASVHDLTVGKILEITNRSSYAFRWYRTARLTQDEKQFTCSISDMLAIMTCLNEVRNYAKPLTLEDMYHPEEFEKIAAVVAE